MTKGIIPLSTLTALAIGALAVSTYTASASFESGPSASGHGNYTEADGELRIFSFHVRTHDDGVARSSFVVNNRSNGHFLKGDLKCLNVDENRATLSGVITSSTVSDEVPVGTLTRFAVIDNGEGEDAPADRMSRFSNFAQVNCETPITGFSLPVQGGNIQIRP